MTKFYGKNKEEVRKSVFSQAKNSLGLASFKTGGYLRTLLEVLGELFYSLKTEDQEGLLDQVDYTRATGKHLQTLALSYGLVPRGAGQARGNITATAKRTGTLRKGSWLLTSQNENLRFKVTQDVSYSVIGTVKIPLEAEFAGSKYNLVTGSDLRFSSVNLDLALQSTTADFPQVAGRDAETDSQLRRRIAARFDASFALDLQKSRYEELIYTGFPSVSQVKIIRVPRGAGSVDIYVKTAAGLPDSKLLSDIKSKLQAKRLLVRDLQALPPTLKSLTLRAKVASSSDAKGVRSALSAKVASLLIGESLSVQDLYNAVSTFHGVEITSPSSNVPTSESELLDLKTLDVTVRP
ncbi:MAG: baseplate J/gp47 family protein [Spirochaetota bacterium]